jgi:hypothetical protein
MNRARRAAGGPFSLVDLSYTVPGRTTTAIPAARWRRARMYRLSAT